MNITHQHHAPAFDLLLSTVGKSLHAAIRDLGCPTLPVDLLTAEQQAFFQQEMNGLSEGKTSWNGQIVAGLKKGTVLRVGVSPEGHNLLTVRFPLRNRDVTLTLSYFRDEWAVYNIDAIQSRRREFNRLVLGGIGGSLITAVIAFFAWGIDSDDLIMQAEQQGYVVMSQEQYNEQIKTSEAIGAARVEEGTGQAAVAGTEADGQKDASAAASTTDTSVASDAATGQGAELTFTLEEGMTTYDLTSFLLQQGLIDDQAAFNQQLTERGIDTRLQPKTYTFRQGMTEEQLLTALDS